MLLTDTTVLTAVARVVAEASTLGDVVSRLAEVLRDVVPFERLHVLRLDRSDSVVLYVVRASGEMEVTGHRIADAGNATEPALDADARSRMLSTVRHGAHVHGAVWCTSSRANAFDESHQMLLDSVSDLLALALQHDALQSTESLRRERLDSLDRLLHTVAESLDVRQIFADVSEVIRGGLPHDV